MTASRERMTMRAITKDVSVADLAGLAQSSPGLKVPWSFQGEELSVNLVVFAAGDRVAEHINDEVEVLLVGVAGEGTVAVDGQQHVLHAGCSLIIPRGTRRSTRAMTDRFAYLSCHRRRSALRPASTPPSLHAREASENRKGRT